MSEEKENKALGKKSSEIKTPEKTAPENKETAKQTVSDEKSKPESASKLFYILSVLLLIIFSVAFVFINNRVNEIEKGINSTRINNDSIVNDSNNRIRDTLSRFTDIQKKLEDRKSVV